MDKNFIKQINNGTTEWGPPQLWGAWEEGWAAHGVVWLWLGGGGGGGGDSLCEGDG